MKKKIEVGGRTSKKPEASSSRPCPQGRINMHEESE
jgi:hypothetical protein